MLYTGILAFHIIAACTTGFVLVAALYIAWRGLSTMYSRLALVLGSIAAFEVATGTLLAVLSPTLSAVALSAHIAAYLGVCLAVEVLLFVKMQKIALHFPVIATASPVLASTLLFVAAISYGF